MMLFMQRHFRLVMHPFLNITTLVVGRANFNLTETFRRRVTLNDRHIQVRTKASKVRGLGFRENRSWVTGSFLVYNGDRLMQQQ
jgi:hypothetical protein